jgi:hypothetical protein
LMATHLGRSSISHSRNRYVSFSNGALESGRQFA